LGIHANLLIAGLLYVLLLVPLRSLAASAPVHHGC